MKRLVVSGLLFLLHVACLVRAQGDELQCLPDLGGRIGIVLICHERVQDLERTLNSLLFKVRGVDKENVLAVQDGDLKQVTQVLERFGVSFVQRTTDAVALTEDDFHIKRDTPSRKITRHYKFALAHAFEQHFKDADGVIVVEDDMLFSPDFLEYFVNVKRVLDVDPSTFIASAWNDNGFRGLARDKHRLLRTNHFPGLGWLLSRRLWDEIKSGWPQDHWDWFLRNPQVVKGRECIYPEVPRVYHTGWNGTFMNMDQHLRYFSHIVYNLDPSFRWDTEHDFDQVLVENYDATFLNTILHKGYHVQNGKDLVGPLSKIPGMIFVVWHHSNPDPRMIARFKPLARQFGIWPQLLRGARDGVHQFWFGVVKIILINTFDPTQLDGKLKRKKTVWFHGFEKQSIWVPFKPPGARVFPNGRILVDEMSE